MSGGQHRLEAELAVQNAISGNAGCQDGGLRVGGLVELFGGTGKTDRSQIFTKCFAGFSKGLTSFRKIIIELFAHADML